MTDANHPTEITFEAGYERLKAIAERIDQEEVPVSELCELFAEGKGLERALTDYLDTQRSRLEEIERGEGVQAFSVVASAAEGNGARKRPPEGSSAAAPRGAGAEHRPGGPGARAADGASGLTTDELPF